MAKTGTGIRPENRCTAPSKKTGKRCRAAKTTLKDVNTGQFVRYRVCLGHLIASVRPEKIMARHGFDPRAGAKLGGRPRKPTAIELLRQKVEEEFGLDAVLQPYFDALVGAVKPVVVGNGAHAHVVDYEDLGAKMAASDKILDRVYGKPKQQTEITGSGGGPVAVEVPDDTERQLEVARMLAESGALGDLTVVQGNGNANGNGNGKGN